MNRSIATALLVYVLLAVGLFFNAMENPFHYDDRHSIESNKHLRSLTNIPSFFTDPGTFSSERRGTMFRPFLLSSYALNYALHENWVPGFRLVNLLIHALCATLLFALVYAGANRCREAWAIGLLFLLHPIHGEPVNYISSRSDLLVSFFYLLALYVAGRPWSGWMAYAAALLTKSVAITMPVAIAVWQQLKVGSLLLRRGYFAGLILLSGFYFAAIVANRFLDSSLAKAPRSFEQNLWTQVKALVYYIWLYCMPRTLSVEHPFTVAQDMLDPPVLFSSLFLLSLLGLALYGRRRIESLAFAFFLLVMLPTTFIPLNILVSERRSYLASAGLIGIAVWAWGRLADKRRAWGLATGCCLCMLMAMIGWTRNPVWAGEISLWEDAVRKGPGMFRARANLGLAYNKANRQPEAIVQLEQALAINPDYAEAWVELGNIYHQMQRLDAAERAYRHALSLSPSLEGIYYNLGNIALGRGKVQEAIAFYGETLSRNPSFADAYNNRGQAYEVVGDLQGAMGQYQYAVEYDPGLGGAWFNLGSISERLAQSQIALSAYRRARDILSQTSEYQVFANKAQQAIERLEINDE